MGISLDEYDKILNRPGRRRLGGDEGFIDEEDEAELEAHWQRFCETTGKDVYSPTASPEEIDEFLEWLVEKAGFSEQE